MSHFKMSDNFFASFFFSFNLMLYTLWAQVRVKQKYSLITFHLVCTNFIVNDTQGHLSKLTKQM